MSEQSDGKWAGPFFLGFLLGVLLCLGTVGTFAFTWQRRMTVEVERARMEADLERARAEKELYAARIQAAQAAMAGAGARAEKEKNDGR